VSRGVINGVICIILLSPVLVWGQSATVEENTIRPPLISHEELQRRLHKPGLRLLDARTRAEYEKGHIPTAVWVDVKAAEKLAVRPDGLTDHTAWEAWTASLSLGPDIEVFVYDGQRQLEAARTWWLLRYLGLNRVGLIDGNFPLWQGAGRPVSSKFPTISPSPLKVNFRFDRLATRNEVCAVISQGGARIIDARSEPEFTGKEKRSSRVGHIPGACLLEWSELVDRNGQFLAPDTLRSRLAKQGIRLDEPVITHCQSGGRASVDTFVLERLGIRARNYYLGWSDWGNAAETPVEVK
jgi:thiosulfate/3-mercaptopyruvate sulfurtransferase